MKLKNPRIPLVVNQGKEVAKKAKVMQTKTNWLQLQDERQKKEKEYKQKFERAKKIAELRQSRELQLEKNTDAFIN